MLGAILKKNSRFGAEQELVVRKKLLAAHVSAALMAMPLMANAAPPEPPPVQTQSGGAPRTGAGPAATASQVLVPVLAPQQPLPAFPPLPQEYTGIPWGSFLVFPEVVLAATYDDNIYAQRGDFTNRAYPVKDLIYTLSPSVAVKSNWQRHALNFDVGMDADHYQDRSQENVTDYWAGFDGRYDLGPLTNAFGGARFSRDHEDRSAPGALSATQQAEPTLFDHTEAHLGLATGTGPWRVRAGGTYDEYDYKNGISTAGLSVNQDFRDRSVNSLGARLSYVVSQSYEVFGQYATDSRDYRNNIPGLTFNRDSDGYRAALGLRLNLPQQAVQGELFAGTMKQDFDYSGFADVSAPYYGALVTWRPARLTTVTGFIDRSLEETTVYDGSTYASSSIDTTYGFEVEHKLTSDLSLNGRAAYTRSAFQGLGRLDTIIDAGAGLRYYVTPSVFVGADLRLIDRNSNVLDAQYSRNQFMFSVGYTPARSKNYSIIPEGAAPAAPGTPGLYSGFYVGAQIGHGGLLTETFGPRGGGGFDLADMGSLGASYGLFAGWGKEFGNWYLGAELEGGDSSARWYHNKNKDDAPTEYVNKDAGYAASLRAGYILDGGLLYGRLGLVRTDFHTYYAENQFASGAFDKDHTETGSRFGVGMDIPASANLFVRLDYSATDYGQYDVPYQSSGGGAITTERFDLRENLFNVGLGWRFGGDRPQPVRRAPEELRGFFVGGGVGHGTTQTKLTGTHREEDPLNPGTYLPASFTGDFANAGGGANFFGGYGYTFGRVYLGVELEADAANFGWYHERQTGGSGGRDFAVEKRGSYGGALRVGYALPNGSLLYGRIGQVRTRFNTTYNKGASSAQWIDRTDRLNGTRLGIGAEVPAFRSAFVRMDYTYTKYDSYGFVTGHAGGANADEMTFNNRENLFRLGLGFRF